MEPKKSLKRSHSSDAVVQGILERASSKQLNLVDLTLRQRQALLSWFATATSGKRQAPPEEVNLAARILGMGHLGAEIEWKREVEEGVLNDLERELALLEREFISLHPNQFILESYGTIRNIEKALEKAERYRDVSDVRMRFEDLKEEVIRDTLEKMILEVEIAIELSSEGNYAKREYEQALKFAELVKGKGVPVDDLAIKLERLKPRVFRSFVEKNLNHFGSQSEVFKDYDYEKIADGIAVASDLKAALYERTDPIFIRSLETVFGFLNGAIRSIAEENKFYFIFFTQLYLNAQTLINEMGEGLQDPRFTLDALARMKDDLSNALINYIKSNALKDKPGEERNALTACNFVRRIIGHDFSYEGVRIDFDFTAVIDEINKHDS